MFDNKKQGHSNIRIVICKKDFNKLRSDKRFHLLIRITRILNSMRFSWSTTVKLPSGNTPGDSRDRTASFLYMCALLYESFQKVYPEINKEYHHLPSFKQGLMRIFNDKKRKVYHNTVFKKARNQIAFHFERKAIEESIGLFKIKGDEVVFVESHSNRTGDVFFPFSDDLVYNYLMETSEFDNKTADKFKVLLNNIANLSKEFINASENLIIEALEEMGFQIGRTQKK